MSSRSIERTIAVVAKSPEPVKAALLAGADLIFTHKYSSDSVFTPNTKTLRATAAVWVQQPEAA